MDPTSASLLAAHLAVTACMVGLIWFVQVVHYPLFTLVGRPGFAPYELAHQRRTSWVVGPLMGAEVLLAGALVLWPPAGLGRTLPVMALAVLVAVHASTLGLHVPAHRRLSEGFDQRTVARLVRSNWLRTAGWSARGILATTMVAVAA